MSKFSESIIRYCFYLLFFLVPLIFFSGSFELFEYNKMMLTYAVTIIIVSAWIINFLASSKVSNDKSLFLGVIRRTPFDIPILLYLGSHILSTIFSIDAHTSIWGYYSRFHEGLIATISYIILYYAAVSNLNKKDVIRILFYSLASGIIVSLWGALEHFGASPSCLFITGKFDVSCWIQDVKGRVFATLGQPNWMAAYLNILILTAASFALNLIEKPTDKNKAKNSSDVLPFNTKQLVFVLISALLFAALLFTRSRSGILGLIAGLAVFLISYVLIQKNPFELKKLVSKPLIILFGALLFVSALFGLPFSQLEKLNLEDLLSRTSTSNSAPVKQQTVTPDLGYIDIGITESGDIRKIVWKGAIKVWQRYPIFGSGVETFAHAYYQDRPVEHNMVSEWDFLYNKAHNEFLNILATTGAVGLLAYLSMIAVFTLWFLRFLTNRDSSESLKSDKLLVASLFAAYVSILVTNFFGFSVVIIALFFFLIPAFSIIIIQPQTPPLQKNNQPKNISVGIWIIICAVILLASYLEWTLLNMWTADKSFAYGKNLDGINEYTTAYTYLNSAVTQIPDEPIYRDELSYNEAVIALALFQQASGSAQEKLNQPYGTSNVSAATLIQKAISDSNQTVEQSPNVLQFWKTRTKVFYQLATIDKQYLQEALNSIQKAAQLAPTDAKVHYNYGLLLGQSGQVPQAIKIMEQTVKMKPNYTDAYYALGLYYDGSGQKQKARTQMEYILKRIGTGDERANKWLQDNPK